MVNLWPALVDILQDCTDGQLERLGNTSALVSLSPYIFLHLYQHVL